MKTFLGAIFASFALIAPAYAASITVDFEDADPSLIRVAQGPEACIPNLIVQHDGFTFANNGLCGAYQSGATPSGPSIGLFFASTGPEASAEVNMTRDDGTNFDLLGLDLLRGASFFLDLEGYRDGARVYNQRLFINPGQFITPQLVSFLDVDRIRFLKTTSSPNSIGFDNLAVNVVPIPAAVWLFGSALFGLGVLRRRSL